MGHEQHRLLGFLPDAQQFRLHDVAGLGIERGERLIHQQHVGIGRECARQPDPLFHAARKLVGIMLLEAYKPHHFDKILADRASFGLAHALELETQLDIVGDRSPRQQAELLEHHRAVGAGSGNRPTIDHPGPGVGRYQSEQHIQERAFAAARRTHDGHELALLHIDVEVAERRHRFAVLRAERQIDVICGYISAHRSSLCGRNLKSLLFVWPGGP